ncbi:LacI family DNA-binding transcriptional regulator [Paenibacillus caui]|uniref:LacI family DNA-binding transcriptional regulator n=1 Tax=Paenibacillus caui TaxID=2873927 RepID=UPI001CA81A5E|nr:LacI family DNA-binding transcriptional regulator [Paenibacillus caui]
MVRIKDVAKRANVSTATVSHVINGTRFVMKETRKKVYDAMRELNYRPNSVARSLRSKKSKIIGLLVPIMPQDTSNFFFMSVAQGIENVLKESGYNLILSNSKEDIDVEREQIKAFNSHLIDGLIMAPTFDDHSYLSDMTLEDYPLVFIDRKPTRMQGDCVLSDGGEGAYQAVTHFLKKGHRRIGFITGSLGITSSDERLDGYKRALTEKGIAVDDKLIQVADSAHSSFKSGYVLAKKLVQETEVTAILVANNVMTMGALSYLQEHKIKIPDEIAIIGFDDYEWAQVTQPALSMVRQPSIELGETAARMLLERIEQPENPYREVKLATELVIRNSS